MRIDPCPHCGEHVSINSDHAPGCPKRQGGVVATAEQRCRNCDMPIEQTVHGPWVHKMLLVTFCSSQFAETVYNNWDHRVAFPKEED